jgi:hypothetical protein
MKVKIILQVGDIIVYRFRSEDEYRLVTNPNGAGVLLGGKEYRSRIFSAEKAHQIKWTGRVIRGKWKGNAFVSRKLEPNVPSLPTLRYLSSGKRLYHSVLASKTQITEAEARELVEDLFKAFPELRKLGKRK